MDDLTPPSSKILETPEQKQERLIWEQTAYKRAPWIKDSVHYAETIPPQKDQESNLKLSDEQVFQPRNEPIGKGSLAFPMHPKDHAPAGMYEGGGGPDLAGPGN